jgi:1,4-alpha-glucan branching enzyme
MAKASSRKKESFTIHAPGAANVALAGDFTSWELDPKPMKKEKQGIWSVSLNLQPGRYEYKFIVDGQWWEDPGAKEKAPNDFGGFNSVRIIT